MSLEFYVESNGTKYHIQNPIIIYMESHRKLYEFSMEPKYTYDIEKDNL